ncbi:MAG: protein TolR [Pseudomonadota bacterium]|nr:protein TolR [Pseudomonadota bacterium]
MSLSNSPFQRVKRPLASDMNVVPYIDVMLVLLVIFMVTAPMLSTGLTVDLPEAETSALSVSQQQPAIVSIQADRQYFLRIGDQEDQALSLDELQATLTEQQITNPELTVLINGDQTVPYGDIVRLMASLQQAGLQQVGLITATPDEQ